MRSKSLWQVSVTTTLECEDAVTELLARMFARPVAVYTNEETKVTVASVYCERSAEWTPAKRADLMDELAAIRAGGVPVDPEKVSSRKVPREDWAESWKRHFKPIEIGARLLVKPGWIKRRPRKGQAVVVLDPGLSFGTGNHPTTAFCLRALVDWRTAGGQSFWDAGTGSGILAIAAAKLAYSPVRATDFDAEAVRVARANARKNGVLGRIQFAREDIKNLPSRSRVKYGVVCANLTADLLLSTKSCIVNRLRRDGALVLSGILKKEFAGVKRAFEQAGMRLVRATTEKEWRSGVFVFRGKVPPINYR